MVKPFTGHRKLQEHTDWFLDTAPKLLHKYLRASTNKKSRIRVFTWAAAAPIISGAVAATASFLSVECGREKKIKVIDAALQNLLLNKTANEKRCRKRLYHDNKKRETKA